MEVACFWIVKASEIEARGKGGRVARPCAVLAPHSCHPPAGDLQPRQPPLNPGPALAFALGLGRSWKPRLCPFIFTLMLLGERVPSPPGVGSPFPESRRKHSEATDLPSPAPAVSWPPRKLEYQPEPNTVAELIACPPKVMSRTSDLADAHGASPGCPLPEAGPCAGWRTPAPRTWT